MRISINYFTSAELKRLIRSIRADPDDDQPGWFLHAYKDEGYTIIVPYTRIRGNDVVRAISNFPLAEKLTQEVTFVNCDHDARAAERKRAAQDMIERGQKILERIALEEEI